MDVSSLGEGKIDVLYQSGLLHRPVDLYELKYADILGLSKFIRNNSNITVKNTEKITVEYSPQKDWMHRLCLSDGWEKNVNCKRY